MNKNLALTFLGKIQNEFIGNSYNGVGITEVILSHIAGEKIEWYETKIDDVVDDDETKDTLLMKACFTTKDKSIDIGIYYDNVTRKIDYVNIRY